MDWEQIKNNVSNLVIDYYLEKDCKKYKPVIPLDLVDINKFIDDNSHEPDRQDTIIAMNLGYWIYRIKEDKDLFP